jgi:hypothetical protein
VQATASLKLKTISALHARKKLGTPPADVDFAMWKTVVVRIHLPQKWNALSFIKICHFAYKKVCDISVKPKAFHKTSAPTSQFWKFFILNLSSFHFHFVAIKSGLIWQDKWSCFFPTFSVCVRPFKWTLTWSFWFTETRIVFVKMYLSWWGSWLRSDSRISRTQNPNRRLYYRPLRILTFHFIFHFIYFIQEYRSRRLICNKLHTDLCSKF